MVGNASKGPVEVSALSSLAAFYYVLLFRLVRRSSIGASTSNPTWIRASAKSADLASLTWKEIETGLSAELNHIQLLDNELLESSASRALAEVNIADSCQLPIADGSIDAVITSPPYCTRIDYAVATRIELAVLNYGSSSEFESLRRSMLGTTLANPPSESNEISLGATALNVLEQIRSHPSKASASYYYATFADYFCKLRVSLAQIARVMKQRGTVTIVIQDSSYKNIHIDLAKIVRDFLEMDGFSLESKWDYPVAKTMRQIHTISRNHNEQWRPTESALLLRKG